VTIEGRLNAIISAVEARADKMRTAEERTEWDSLQTKRKEYIDMMGILEVQEKDQAKRAAEAKPFETPAPTVGKSKMESKEARNIELGKLIVGFTSQNGEQIEQARTNLIEGGHYEKRDMVTLIDPKGGLLIPTSVSNEITELEKEYGFVSKYGRSFGNILSGSLKLPNVLSKMSFSAVTETGSITGKTITMGGIELKANKFAGTIIWSNEIGDQLGSVLVPLIQRQVAEGLAAKKDELFLKGDGTSADHNIKGLEALTGNFDYVRTSTAASGNNTYATLDAEDYLNAMLNVAPASRKRAMYVFHPNMEIYIRQIKDGNGQFVFAMPADRNGGVPTLWGYPVAFTEEASFASGASAVYGYIVDPNLVAYADGRALSLKQLDQATLSDSAGNSVNLAATDQQALRFTAMFDVKANTATVDDAGTTKGGFSVLKTNS